ncbi:MAG: aromatic ring-hydroxylating dioxygenase subunit alpha [Sandaracinaceae bacterium]
MKPPALYGALDEALLARAWAYLADTPAIPDEEGAPTAWPFTHLPGSLDEPVLATWEVDRLRVLSNVCTHRGAVLLDAPLCARTIRCPYHGRRFGLDGSVQAAPGFATLPREPLPQLRSARLGPMLFAALAPDVELREMLAPFDARLGFLDLDAWAPDPSSERDFTIDAHFALWCENYLEGMHIPYVHPALSRTLELAGYETEVYEHGVLQIGEAKAGEPAFELPDGHPDFGSRVAAYYVFLFPLTALNFYPWGLSLNAIQPLGPDRTRIVYRAYVRDASLRERGAGAGLDDVEAEDDAIVERTQRGVRSRMFRLGALSEAQEAGVRWFRETLGSQGG